jgi:hypothetical protein
MKVLKLELLLLVVASVGLATVPAAEAVAGSCHAHSHSHDQCGWHTRSRTKSGGSVFCDASTNTLGVHAHAFSGSECFLFFCNKVVGGHGWWKSGCSGPKHYWWHANAGTGRYVVVSDEPAAEVEVLVPVEAPRGGIPLANGERPVKDGIALQGITAADESVVELDLSIAIADQTGEISTVMKGTAALGGPKSDVPRLVTTGDLRDVLRQVEGDEGVNMAKVVQEFVSRRVKVPTNQPFELLFNIDSNVGGDDPSEKDIESVDPGREERVASAFSFGATLRLTDQSGAFTLKDLEQMDERGSEAP